MKANDKVQRHCPDDANYSVTNNTVQVVPVPTAVCQLLHITKAPSKCSISIN